MNTADIKSTHFKITPRKSIYHSLYSLIVIKEITIIRSLKIDSNLPTTDTDIRVIERDRRLSFVDVVASMLGVVLYSKVRICSIGE